MNQSDKIQLTRLRKILKKELLRMRISEPKISIACDYRTLKARLCYSVYVDKGFDLKGERIISKKQKYLYLKNITIYDEQIIKHNLSKYIDDITSDIQVNIREVSTDKDSIEYWSKVYTSSNMRYGNIELSEGTLRGDKQQLRYLIEYLEKNEPKMLNIWNWIEGGRKCFYRYTTYKQTIPSPPSKYNKVGKVWSDGGTNTSYRRIRAFFNWLPEKVDGFPNNLLNKMKYTPSDVSKKVSITPQEIEKIKKFINDNKDSYEWSYFIPMLCVMLETGCRIKELVQMKINDIEPTTKTWKFKGKGQFGGKERVQRLPKYLWEMIEELVVDEDGFQLTNKEYVFHSRFYNSYSNRTKWKLIEDKTKRFTTAGWRKRFGQMIEELNLNKKITPHSCRRYYITEMLKKSKGDIPLVANLVGHSSWDMVKRYARSVIDEDTITNVGLFNEDKPIGVSIPLMITKKMRITLKDMMYSEEKVRTLTPQQAHEIIQRGY